VDETKMDIDEFIERNEKAIFRYCLSLCARRELAEELTQETFIRVLANYALLSIQPEGQRLAWTFTTAKNLALDSLRAKKREEKFAQENQSDEPTAEMESGKDLETFLAKISPVMREVLLMKYELGMNSREISQKLLVPEGTIRRRIQLGITKLKEDLED
jgi:RNA polymerase sigma-70 factor (ECF subfamily)